MEWRSQDAFEKLKVMLTKAHILGYPDLSKRFYLFTDTSDLAVGSVLAQKEDGGKDHQIAYASRTLQKYERNYGINELALLATIWSLGHLRPYLLGAP